MLTGSSFRMFRLASRAGLLCLALLATCVFAQSEAEQEIDWVYGPVSCPLGNVAAIDLPDGYQFVDGDGTRTLLEWMQNPVGGQEMGFVMPVPTDADPSSWFVIFEYNPIGYVRDDDKDKLDADALLKNITEGTEHANEIRREKGWGEIHVDGWQIPPYYDERTNNLKWAIIGSSAEGKSVNFSVRLLGRGGAMSADLVIDPEDLERVLPEFDRLIERFSFTPDNRYAAFKEGDKVAKYGLTALVAGGAGAVAMKTGLLAKFWKFIVIGVLAAFATIKRALSALFSRRGRTADPSAAGPMSIGTAATGVPSLGSGDDDTHRGEAGPLA